MGKGIAARIENGVALVMTSKNRLHRIIAHDSILLHRLPESAIDPDKS
jgi:hypothetical protein